MEQFSQLDPTGKVEAVLATLLEPCPMDVVLEMAGIDLAQLGDAERASIKDLFEKWSTGDELQDPSTYFVPVEQQQTVIDRLSVESKSVHEQIASIGLKMFGIRP